MKILSAHAEETEQRGRPAVESLEVVRQAGDFALRMPVAHGGSWADTSTVVRRLAELGRSCPSTAWNVGTSAVSKTMTVSGLGDALPDAFTADPNAQACGSGVPAGRAERGPDGTRVSGRWPSVSGCEDSTWAGLGVMDGLADGLADGAGPTMALIPLTDLRIERTWDMAGMRGTGSHSLVAENVLVPDEHIFRVPFTLAFRLFAGLTVLAPVVGATRGALDVINEMFASDRKPYMSAYTRMGESAGARLWLAEATRLTDRAGQTMLSLAAAVDSGAITDSDAPRLSSEMTEASRDARAAIELMLDLHGTSGFANSNDLQRFWRDVAVGGRHPHLNPYLAAERYGEALIPR
jgi:alkylation response protein AidB-like acyl-CoA dehydrogenase